MSRGRRLGTDTVALQPPQAPGSAILRAGFPSLRPVSKVVARVPAFMSLFQADRKRKKKTKRQAPLLIAHPGILIYISLSRAYKHGATPTLKDNLEM